MRTLPVLAAAGTLLLLSIPASGQDAVALFTQGRSLVEQGRWAEACPLFAEAHRLQKEAIGITINLAECLEHTGKTASAWSAYREGEFLARKAGDDARARYAHDHAAVLEPKLSRLRIDAAATPGLIIHRDDQEVGKGVLGTAFPVDPGPHKIEATAPGYLVWSASITVGAERDLKTVSIPVLAPDPAGAGAPFAWTGQRIAGAAVAGVGLAGLVAGAALGGVTLKKMGDLKTSGECTPDLTVCTASGRSTWESARTLAHTSTAALAAGGAALVAGVVVVVTGGPKRPAPPASGAKVVVGPVVGAGMTGVVVQGGW